MKENAMTRDELVEAVKQFGNHPVVWSGKTGLVRDAVGDAVLVHHNDSPLISLEPANRQSNVGDVPVTADVMRVRDDLRAAQTRFAESYDLYVDGHATRIEFVHVKRDYDATIGRVLDVLKKF